MRFQPQRGCCFALCIGIWHEQANIFNIEGRQLQPNDHQVTSSSSLGCSPGAKKMNQSIDLIDLLDKPTSNACAQALCVTSFPSGKRYLWHTDSHMPQGRTGGPSIGNDQWWVSSEKYGL